jgi:hypothetical protein
MAAQNDTRFDPRGGPRDRTLSVGDREREAVGDILREQHLEGRLDSDEFQKRLERCLTAKTYAELDQLIADFPRQQEEEDRQGRARERRPWPLALLPLAVLAAIVLTGGHPIWLALPVFFLFVVRPLFWRSRARRYGGRSCGPRYPTRTETRA